MKRSVSPDPLPNVGIFLLAGYIAYTFIYFLSPGYVFTGYRFRLAPFTVFFSDVMIAAGIYIIVMGVMALLTWHRERAGPPGGVPSGALASRIHRACGGAASAMLLLYWLQLQFAYVSLMPPDQFSILKTLAQTPYKGKSFVSNAYAAPIAAYTGHWAYIDEELAQAKIEEREGIRRLTTDDKYLWLADRGLNPDYLKPEYFMCLLPQTLPSVLAKVKRERGEDAAYPGCLAMGLVKHAMSQPRDVIPRAELVAIDTAGVRKYGHETWAIVKLHWDDDATMRSQHEAGSRSR